MFMIRFEFSSLQFYIIYDVEQCDWIDFNNGRFTSFDYNIRCFPKPHNLFVLNKE